MKNNILSTLLSSLAILMAGCSSDMVDNLVPADDSAASKLQLEIIQLEETRGVITSKTFREGDEVLVVVADQDKPGDLTVMRKATYTEGKWILDSELDFVKPVSGMYWSDNTNVEVYYPYDIIKYPYDKSMGCFQIEDLLSQTDILYGYVAEVNSRKPVAKVTCHHAMTRLTFALRNNSDKTAVIDNFYIEPSGNYPFIGITGMLNASGLTHINYNMQANKEYHLEIPSGETQNMDILLAPTRAAYERMMEDKNNGGPGTESWAIVLSINGFSSFFTLNPIAWEAGRQYTYTVDLPPL